MAERVDLLGVHIDPVDLSATLRVVQTAVLSRRPHQFVTVNVDFLKLAKDDPAFRRLLNTADLVVADGMPLVWAAGLLGAPLPARITGADLMLGCAAVAAASGYRVFLLGAMSGVADSAARNLCAQFPGLRVCGTYAPPFGPFSVEEEARIVRLVRAAEPDLLFVALGAPRQDVWIREHMAELGVPVSVGVGGVLNFLAGRVRRAPPWMQRSGLEWFYRLAQEPGRLWRRYIVDDLPVFLELLAQSRIEAREQAGESVPTSAPPIVGTAARFAAHERVGNL